MAADLAHPPIFEQPWFQELLDAHDFRRTGPGEFSNGRASLRIEGNQLTAIPGDGGRPWKTQLGGVPVGGIRSLLTTFLATPSFRSAKRVEHDRARVESAEAALGIVAEFILQSPETHGGIRLRQFLWSIWNGHHVLNLWRLRDGLDIRHREAVQVVFAAWWDGYLGDESLRKVLMSTGEFDRWESVRAGPSHQRRLGDALDAVADVLIQVPPGDLSRELARVDELLRRIGERVRNSGGS